MCAAQALMPFAPGTLVEVMPVPRQDNVDLRGKAVEEEYMSHVGNGEMDPDLIDALQYGAHAGTGVFDGQKAQEEEEDIWEDTVKDLQSGRFLSFYSVPKVKFALHFFNYINYMLYSAIALWISGAELG